MTHLKYGLTIFTVLFFLTSCADKKDKVSGKKSLSTIDYKTEGYTQATIVFDENQSEACQYTFHTAEGQKLETSEFPEQYKKAGAEVWLKFLPLKRMTQCKGHQPIAINELVDR